MLMYYVNFSGSSKYLPYLLADLKKTPLFPLTFSSTVIDTPFTAEDVILKPVAAPQSREADPLQSNRLL